MTTESFDTLTGTGAAVAFSHSPQQFDTLTGSGGGVQFTTTAGAVTLNFDTIAGSALARDFSYTDASTFTAATMTVEAWDAANSTKLADLDSAYEVSFLDELSNVGRGQATVLIDDTDYTSAKNARHLRFKIGNVYAFTSRIERQEFTVDRGERGSYAMRMSGRGIAAALDDVIVYPRGGITARPSSDSRTFSWASPELSTDSWPSAVVAHSGLAPNARTVPPVPDPWFPPKGWSSVLSGSDWIWSRFTGFGTLAGTSLFRSTFIVSGAQRVAIFYTASSRCRIYIDGILLTPSWTSEPNEESFIYAHRATPYLSNGTHHIAVEAESQAWTPTLPGVSRGLLHVSVHAGGGVGGSYSSGNLLLGTSSSWKCLDYPTVWPAPTVGTILSTLLVEAQNRGLLSLWSLSCTSTTDSAGQPWSQDAAFTFQIGSTYLDVLRQMADSAIEFRVRNGFSGPVLDVFRKDTVLNANAATYSVGVNIGELDEVRPR